MGQNVIRTVRAQCRNCQETRQIECGDVVEIREEPVQSAEIESEHLRTAEHEHQSKLVAESEAYATEFECYHDWLGRRAKRIDQ